MTEIRNEISAILEKGVSDQHNQILIDDEAGNGAVKFELIDDRMSDVSEMVRSLAASNKSDFMIAGAAIEQVVTYYDHSLSGAWRFVTPISYFNMSQGGWNDFLSRIVAVYLRLNSPKTIRNAQLLRQLGKKPLLKLQLALVQLTIG